MCRWEWPRKKAPDDQDSNRQKWCGYADIRQSKGWRSVYVFRVQSIYSHKSCQQNSYYVGIHFVVNMLCSLCINIIYCVAFVKSDAIIVSGHIGRYAGGCRMDHARLFKIWWKWLLSTTSKWAQAFPTWYQACGCEGCCGYGRGGWLCSKLLNSLYLCHSSCVWFQTDYFAGPIIYYRQASYIPNLSA